MIPDRIDSLVLTSTTAGNTSEVAPVRRIFYPAPIVAEIHPFYADISLENVCKAVLRS